IFISDNGGCHESTRSQAAFLNVKGETGTPDSFDAYEYPWANVSNTPFRMYKHWVHEGGIATPFIAFYPPLIKTRQINHLPAHIIDIMPTFLDLSGGKYPDRFNGQKIQPMEGNSLVPLFKGNKLKRNPPLFWEHEGNRAVRCGDWKLVSSYDSGKKEFLKWELYNLSEDRSELNDLRDKHPEKVAEMLRMYEKWAERTGVVSKEVIDRRK
ncbi:MAG: sulfatase-like hydrolase/transferase, partial [Bacteroidales bacterium]|nr:sulfatase-like hydrolase/transferase [Bacteroidales bacterium]